VSGIALIEVLQFDELGLVLINVSKLIERGVQDRSASCANDEEILWSSDRVNYLKQLY